MKKYFLVICILLIIFASNVWAETKIFDSVHTKDGQSLTGIIIEQVPGEQIKLQTPGGSVFVIDFENVLKIKKVEIDIGITQEEILAQEKEKLEMAKNELEELQYKLSRLQEQFNVESNTTISTSSSLNGKSRYSNNEVKNATTAWLLSILLGFGSGQFYLNNSGAPFLITELLFVAGGVTGSIMLFTGEPIAGPIISYVSAGGMLITRIIEWVNLSKKVRTMRTEGRIAFNPVIRIDPVSHDLWIGGHIAY